MMSRYNVPAVPVVDGGGKLLGQVTFDDVIDVMYRTGVDLQARYRETAGGGLAELWRRRAKRTSPAPAPGAAVDVDRNRCD